MVRQGTHATWLWEPELGENAHNRIGPHGGPYATDY